MNNPSGAAGAVPVVAMFDYLQPNLNRPDLFSQRAYPLSGGAGGGSAGLRTLKRRTDDTPNSIQKHKSSGEERSPLIAVYYTLGLIVVSAAIFLSLAAWSNVLLSWFDSIYVSPVVDLVTKSRLYFAITITIIALVVVGILLIIWYYFTVEQNK
jgi:hypothetical protein